MTRNLKALGLALLAVFAMSAVAAQGASAAVDHIESETEKTDITGTNVGVGKLIAGVAEVTCSNNLFHGTLSEQLVTTVEVTPTYSGCKLGENEATVEEINGGCKYRFTSETINGHLPVDLICNHTGSITVTGPACTIHFSDTHTGGGSTVNQNLLGATLTQEGAGTTRDLMVHATVSNITYEGTGFGCAILGINGTRHNGVYTETVTLKGFKHLSAHGTADHVGLKLVTTP